MWAVRSSISRKNESSVLRRSYQVSMPSPAYLCDTGVARRPDPMHVAALDGFRIRPADDADAEDPGRARPQSPAALGPGRRRPADLGGLDHRQRAGLERHGADVLDARPPEAARQGPLLPRGRPYGRSGDAGDRPAGAEAGAALAGLREGERHPPLLRREPDHPAHEVLPRPGAAGDVVLGADSHTSS